MGPLNRSGRRLLILLLLVPAFFTWNIEVLAQNSPSPKQLKLDAITALEQISTTDPRLQRTLDRAVKDISQSLSYKGQSLFLDDFRILPPPKGERVFREEIDRCATLLGNVTRDPELRFTPQGTAVATFGLAVNRRYRQEDQQREEVCSSTSSRSDAKPRRRAHISARAISP